MLKYNEIAVIDDGVNMGFYENIFMVQKSIEIDSDCNIKEYENDEVGYSHGTTCAAIICKYTKDAVINSVKIINESNKTTGKQLIKAIEWCLENNIGIVNLSLGSTDINEKNDICEIINKAAMNGMIIVAASSNDGKITYPASFSNIIGVKTLSHEGKYEGYLYNYNSIDGVDILAPSVHKLKNCFEEEESQRCNSFAAPYITAKVHNIVKRCNSEYSPLEIKYMLLERAENYRNDNIVNGHLEWIRGAVVFNIGVGNSFDIENKAYTFSVIEEKFIYEEDLSKILKNIKACINSENMKDFNAIVIKDFNNNRFNLNFFAENLNCYNKGLVYVNDSCEEKEDLNKEYRNNIWFTGMKQCFEANVKKNTTVNKPVILVVGEKNDGISSTLKLAETFKMQGYRCGIYSDISLCELYGMEFLPFKYVYSEGKLKNDSIKSVVNLMAIDLSIVFIEFCRLHMSYIKLVEEILENDIRIIINHDGNDVFTYDEDKYNINLNNKDKVTFKSRNKSYVTENIEELYEYIIDIYD